MTLVRLDFHYAKNTDARTWWTLEDGRPLSAVGRRIYSTASESKTHWLEYWMFDDDIELVRHRISNRGNYSRTSFKASELRASHEEIPPGAE
ncbi:MAG: hypothetical protein QW555_07880 [Nitrososphaerota archaeon]